MEETTDQSSEAKLHRQSLLREKKGRASYRCSGASGSYEGSGIYDTINDIEIDIFENEREDDDITIIDHDNPKSGEVLKWMRTSLRKIKHKNRSINPEVVSFTGSTSTEYSESGESSASFDSGGNVEYSNLERPQISRTRNIFRRGPTLRQLSCRHEQAVTKLNCVNCNKIICDNCMQSSHFGHEIEDMSAATRRLTAKMQKYLSLLSSSTQTFQENIETVIAAESHMQRGYMEMETLINCTADSMIMRINEDKDSLLQTINNHRETKLSQTQSIKRALNSTVKQLTDKFSDVYDSYRQGHGVRDDELVDIIQSNINPDENREVIWAKQRALKNPIIKDHNINIDICSVVNQVNDISFNSIGDLIFRELLPIPIHYPCNLRLHNANFDKISADAKRNKFVQGQTLTFPDSLKTSRIFIVRGNFWFPRKEGNCIDVYSPYGERKTKLELPLIQGPKTILQSSPNEVLVGFSHKDTGGLTALHIPLHGELVVKSTTNVFTSKITELTMEGNTLVTFSAQEGILTVIEVNRDTNIWTTTSAFGVPHKSKTSMDTVLINNCLIYVCSWENDMVSIYSLKGDLMRELSYWNKLSTIGKKLNFCKFRLSMIDSKSSLLLCDKENDNFQILSAEGKWKSFKLPGISHPLDIVALGEKEIWVVLGGGEQNALKQFIFAD